MNSETRCSDGRPAISVIVPIFDEEAVIPELHRRMAAVLDGTGEPWELVCVNDGSRDASLAMLLELRERDARVKVIDFSRNFGQQLAITAGMDFAQGDAVVVIDADLQDPPELIDEMLAKWREGYQVVYAMRASRQRRVPLQTVDGQRLLPAPASHHRRGDSRSIRANSA